VRPQTTYAGDVVDAAFTHQIGSVEDVEAARGEVDPETVQLVGDASVVKLHHRVNVESAWPWLDVCATERRRAGGDDRDTVRSRPTPRSHER
jgi:predicted dinucleotide-utilizing enzyme